MTDIALANNTIVVQLPPKPYTTDELEFTSKIALNNPKCDVAVDCSKIGLITCTALCGFMKLRETLLGCGRRLLFLKVGPVPRGVFSIYGFDQIFDIVDGYVETPSSSEDSTYDRTEAPTLKEGHKRPQRRNYVRMNVYEACILEVSLWPKSSASDNQYVPSECCSQGRLLDISLGGAQIGLDATEERDFKKKQTLSCKFKSYQTSFLLDAQIIEVLPTADGRGISLGVKFFGLKNNPEGQQSLKRFCESIERYWQVEECATV